MKELANDISRCRGLGCTVTNNCRRYLQIGMDVPGVLYSTIETGMHKDSRCIFILEVQIGKAIMVD